MHDLHSARDLRVIPLRTPTTAAPIDVILNAISSTPTPDLVALVPTIQTHLQQRYALFGDAA